MNEQEASELLEKDDETNAAYVSDKYLVEAAQGEYNFKADNEVALGLELGRDMIYATKPSQGMTGAQKAAVSLYNQASASSRANSSNGMGDVVVAKVSEPIEVPAVEAFADLDMPAISKMQKELLVKLIDSTVSTTESVVSTAKDAFEHYAKSASDIQKDLKALKKDLEKNIDQIPRAEHYEFGAYSRFFMVAGKPITDFKEFADVFGSLKSALQFSLHCGVPLAQSNARVCLEGLRQLQKTGSSLAADEYESIVDRVRDDTIDVWKNAVADNPHMALADYPAKTPSNLGGTSKTIGPIASYFDNNVLLWTAPVDYNFMNYSKDQRVDFFGASLERDIALDKAISPSERPKGFDIPTNEELIKLLDVAIEALTTVQRYKEVANTIDSLGSELKSALGTLTKLAKADDPNMTVRSYSPLVTACIQGFTQPHIKLVWLVVRASVMIAALAETSTTDIGKYAKYAQVAKNTSNKILIKLDVEVEPEAAAAKELGYFTSLLLKLKKADKA